MKKPKLLSLCMDVTLLLVFNSRIEIKGKLQHEKIRSEQFDKENEKLVIEENVKTVNVSKS